MYNKPYLSQHGVKGMRWGVRNKPGQGVRGRSQRPSASSMTTNELRQAIERVRLEQQYKSLTKSPSQKAIEGIGEMASSIVKGAVTTVGTAVVLGQLNKAVKKAGVG